MFFKKLKIVNTNIERLIEDILDKIYIYLIKINIDQFIKCPIIFN